MTQFESILRSKIIIAVLPAVMILLLASCASNPARQKTNQNYVLYPSPPDTARIQFLTSITSSDNTTTHKSGFSRFVLGDDETKSIKKPYGVFIRNGKIYVCDSGLGGLEIIDLNKKTFDYFLPEGKGQLKLPLNCFVDDDGKLYVADGEKLQVIIFDPEGNYLGSFGEPEKFKPTDVSVYDNKIWVANLNNHSINVYQKDTYQLLYKFPETETGQENYLYQPTNLFITGDKVFVSDMGDFKIKIFTHEGQYVKSIGSQGTNVGQFVRPKGIAVDRESNLFAVDAGFENVQVFNYEGKLLLYFGGPYKGPGDLWLPAKVAIDYENVAFFRKYVDPEYQLKYLILVTSQYGPDKLNIYGAIEPSKK